MPPSAPTKPTPKRQRMAPEDRRAFILDVAQQLFFARGWDNVTIAHILSEAGLSKGGFYHHFSAKEELLDGIVERFVFDAMTAAQAASAASSGNALQRFNVFSAESIRWKAEHSRQVKFIMNVMLRPGNDLLFARVTAAVNAVAMPILSEIIAQGVDEKVFDVPDITLAAETIIQMSHGRRSVLARALQAAEAGELEQATAELDRRMKAEGALIDRLLGLPPASIILTNPNEYRRMLAALTAY